VTTHAHARSIGGGIVSRTHLGEGAAVAGFLLVLLGASFLTVTMLAASIAPAYDYHRAAISDLGVIDETAPIFNVLLVAVAVLNVAAGALLYRSHRRSWILGTYTLAGIGAAGAGFVPLDASDLHSLFALVGFVFFNLEAVATGTLVRGPLRAISYAAGLAGLIYVIVMVIGDSGSPAIFGAIGHGGSERMIVYPVMLWTLVFGGYLIGSTGLRPSSSHAGRDEPGAWIGAATRPEHGPVG
jgi:hypothetical membrane protein